MPRVGKIRVLIRNKTLATIQKPSARELARRREDYARIADVMRTFWKRRKSRYVASFATYRKALDILSNAI